MASLDSPYVVSYWQLMVTYGLTWLLYEIEGFEVRVTLILTWNLGDLDFDLSRLLKVKCKGAIGLPIHGFLLMFNSNIGHNWAPLRDL